MNPIDSDEGQYGGPTNGTFDSSFPLKGVTICCTSVADEKRVQMATMAAEMGAIHRYDLTGDVTHLIVGHYDTPKYRFVAKNRPDVRPMTVNWIESIRELWIAAKEIDIEALELEHTLPTLHSLKFSMTGCDDPVERQSIAEKIKANGADYEGDLTKRITHLISFRTEGAKYKAAKTWGLHIVSIEWLNDSLERGMILDEKLYDPSFPEDQRGKDAWDRSKPRRTSLGKRLRDDSFASLEDGKRKLRRTASTKLNSQNEGIWGDIVGAGPAIQVTRSMQWERPERESIRRTESIENRDQPSAIREVQPTSGIQSAPQGIFAGYHVVGRPFPNFPITEFKDMIISTSAFNGIDLRHVKEATQLLGATYSEDFTPKSQVLVTNSEQGLRKDKLDHARQWKVPIVTANWLWDSISAGIRLEFKGYQLGGKAVSPQILNQKKLQPWSEDVEKQKDMSNMKTFSKTVESRMDSCSKSPKPEATNSTPFTSVDTVIINREEEPNTEPPLTSENSTAATDEASTKSEPLSEIPSNSPKRPPPKADNLPKIPPQDIENAISNLLAKTKTISASATDPLEENRRRGGKRILGRATSNVSTGSTGLSRATSVDSTATHGNAVEWTGPQSNSNILSASGQLRFQGADGDRGTGVENEGENQPPPTQIQYDDPDSKEFKERVMARMMGEKLDPKKREKAVTIGDVAEWSKASGSRRSGRDRVGRERVGYR
ncbi:hypothetical protein B7463_g11245, partial [Scytalidium lignicola]